MSKSSKSPLSRAEVWKQLKSHHEQVKNLHMRDLFAADSERADKYCIRLDQLLVDFSKHRITEDTVALLLDLAESCSLNSAIASLFAGDKINLSEDRAALHTCLRAPAKDSLLHDSENLITQVHEQLQNMEQFAGDLRAGKIRGAGGEKFNKVVNIGIGGSDLGPRLAIEALQAKADNDIDIEFISNLDPKELDSVLSACDPNRTLIIVVSKTFTTLETRTNADAAKQWLVDNGCTHLDKHMVAVTTNQSAAKEFGMTDEHIFYFWDWVGGRYSLWSTVGLSIAIAFGMESFRDLLAGAREVDEHFQTESAEKNIPVILALLSVWYNNFFEAESHAVIPYDQSLRLFPEYLSQLVMESNGKSVTLDGESVEHQTSPVIWGTIGTNAQHAFFQMLHQGTHLIPVDFIVAVKNPERQQQQLMQVSNCLAQSEALMLGQQHSSNLNQKFAGNTPSTTILYDELSPKVLGMLLAIYEHKTFVEATIWNINPFDQWGVELGKKLAIQIIQELSAAEPDEEKHDASTQLLMQEYLRRN
ncbi:MAG: glucose-6-phosphate isomerase [Gammaproteobacteria bacterium]|nr:glucose-6-phosphate isomerase [Gammaproteobacteria bacterium]